MSPPVPPIELQRTTRPRARPDPKSLGFGVHFTDHMFLAEYDPAQGWQSPRVVPYAPLTLDPGAAVFHYGQALFEGLKAFPRPSGPALFRADDHCRRLNETAVRLCMPPIDARLLREGLRALVEADADWMPAVPGGALYIRPVMIATEAFLGVRPATRYLLYALLSPVGAYFGGDRVRIWVEEEQVRAVKGGIGAAKAAANYVASMQAAERAKARGFNQVLWLDAREHRYVEEVGTMNLFARLGDKVITPPLEGTLLAGITRDSVLCLLREWGVAVEERPLSIDELIDGAKTGALQELFGTGTAATIAPIAELGRRSSPILLDPSKATLATRLKNELLGIQQGTVADRHGWIDPPQRQALSA